MPVHVSNEFVHSISFDAMLRAQEDRLLKRFSEIVEERFVQIHLDESVAVAVKADYPPVIRPDLRPYWS